MSHGDVIVAQATSAGVAGVSIVRLSGPDALVKPYIEKLSALSAHAVRPRYAHFTSFLDREQEWIDEGILLYFPSPHSYTGESVLEFQCHGGVILAKLIIQNCLALGARMAEPGEFSLRAVLNQKMTTLKAEAILGMIHAQDEAQARAAIRSMQGEFAEYVHKIATQLREIRVKLESLIDFDGEDGVDAFLSLKDLRGVLAVVQRLRQRTEQAVQLSQDQQICLIGRPNAGKSSWLNRLIAQDAAIVSPQAGTTRDLIEKRMMIGDRWVSIIDTAGLRISNDDIEQQGVKKAKDKTQVVDLSIWVVDVTDLSELDALVADLPVSPLSDMERFLVLWNKRDQRAQTIEEHAWQGMSVYSVTAHQDDDVCYVKHLIQDKLLQPEPDLFYARERHLAALGVIEQKLLETIQYAALDFDVVWIAENMRVIQAELDKLVGLFSTEDLLGDIFGSFCIGK